MEPSSESSPPAPVHPLLRWKKPLGAGLLFLILILLILRQSCGRPTPKKVGVVILPTSTDTTLPSSPTPTTSPWITPTSTLQPPTPTSTATPLKIIYPPFKPGRFQMLNIVPDTTIENYFRVRDLAIADGKIWVATENGLWRYNPKKDSWFCFWPVDPKHPTDTQRGISYFVEYDASSGDYGKRPLAFSKVSYRAPNLWAISEAGLFRINLVTGRYELFTDAADSPLLAKPKLVAAGKTSAWVVYDPQIDVVFRDSLKPWRTPAPGSLQKAAQFFPLYLTELDSEGVQARHHAIPAASFVCIDGEGGPLKYELHSTPTDLVLLGNQLWLAGFTNILRFNLLTQKVRTWDAYSFPADKKRSLFYNETHTFFVDAQNLYLTGRRLLKFDGETQSFAEVTAAEWRADPAPSMEGDSAVRELAKILVERDEDPTQKDDDGLLWVGSSYDVHSGSRFVLSYIRDAANNWKGTIYAARQYRESSYRILKDAPEFWLISDGSLARWNPATHKGIQFHFKRLDTDDRKIKSLDASVEDFTFD